MPGNVEGSPTPGESPESFAERAARSKAEVAWEEAPREVVVAADTVVTIDGDVLGKPTDEETARCMLRRLRGREHQVITGVSVRTKDGRMVSDTASTIVKFRNLGDCDIEAYVATGEPMDKAGAYGIQGFGAVLVERIEGCYFNVMGLPVTRLLSVLEAVGWLYGFPGQLVRGRNEAP